MILPCLSRHLAIVSRACCDLCCRRCASALELQAHCGKGGASSFGGSYSHSGSEVEVACSLEEHASL